MRGRAPEKTSRCLGHFPLFCGTDPVLGIIPVIRSSITRTNPVQRECIVSLQHAADFVHQWCDKALQDKSLSESSDPGYIT